MADALRFWHSLIFYNYVPVMVDGRRKSDACNDRSFSESAHAVAHAAFDRCFPKLILQERIANYIDRNRQQVTEASWEQYAATRLSWSWGADPLHGYVDTFVKALKRVEDEADGYVRAYRLHGSVDRLLSEVPPIYGDLVKWAAYLLGTMHGKGVEVGELPELAVSLRSHWFASFFERLAEAYAALWDRFGAWECRSEFHTVADICVEVLEMGGIYMTRTADGRVWIDVPWRQDGTPAPGASA